MTEQKDKASFQKTMLLKEQEVKHDWFVLDAEGKTLGRLASEIAKILRGKHRPTFTPHVDGGDGVIIINADKVHVTGNKEAQKVYHSHTGFIGGLREISYRRMKERKPEYIIEHAVKGMMPKNRLSRRQMKRLRVFAGAVHNMEAQKPTQVNI
ncbi:MAG: 50S ribosomal protein L13 [Chlamydiota bacterium]|nr:50S ribosomal protein L13 [Chlamydiota bacterium]